MKQILKAATLALATGLLCAGLFQSTLAFAQQVQQAPPSTQAPMPPPTCQGELATARNYNTILLNNTTQFETSARELWGQVQELRAKLAEAEAKIPKEQAKEPVAKGTN
jgi:hypothetical protein